MTLAFYIPVVLFAAEVAGAREALQANISGQAWSRKCTFAVVTEWGAEKSDPARLSSRIRRNESLLDVFAELRVLGEPDDYAGNMTHRMMNDGKWYYGRTTSVGRKKITGGRSEKLEESTNREIESYSWGFCLDGHFPGNEGKTLAQILLEAAELAMKNEEIDGRSCVLISGVTKYGSVKLGLDPEHGYAQCYVLHTKSPGEVYSGMTVGEHPDTVGVGSRTCKMSNVAFQQIDNYFIPVSGVLAIFDGVAVSGEAKWLVTSTRSDFNLEPDFEGTDAFKMDFDDGARVSDYDKPEAHIAYIWDKGDMHPEGAGGLAVKMGKDDFQAAAATSRIWWFLLLNLAVLGCGLGWYFTIGRSRSKSI